MSREQYPYPEDEFDLLGAQRAPKGVHRESESSWTQWLPYLLVVLLVPLLTFGAVKFFSSGPETDPTPSATDTVVDEDSEAADADADDADAEDPTDEPETSDDGDGDAEEGDQTVEPEPTEEPTEEASEEPVDLNYATHVLVLNGAGTQGLAGQVTNILAGQGWTNAHPDNYNDVQPLTTTLYYTSAAMEAEARSVAETLGISELRESSAAASNGVVIVLRSDFILP